MNNSYDNLLYTLYINQRLGVDAELKGLAKKEQYENLLNTLLEVLKENKDASIDELRDILYQKSGLDDALKEFFLQRKVAPGAVISYGSKNFQETLVIGNQEEVRLENGSLQDSVIPMKENTIFDLASCTKLFTSLATLRLVEEKQIKLTDKVRKFAPKFKELNGITIYDLLTFIPLETKRRIDSAKSVEEAENILFQETAKKEIPYGGSRYNDFAPIVLKYVIENVTGMKYKDYLLKVVLKDANMNNTFVDVPTEELEKAANGNYDVRYYNNHYFFMRDYNEPGISTDDKARILGQPKGILSGHAGLFSTAQDMTNLARALSEGKIIDARTRDYMARNKTGIHYVDKTGCDKYTQYYGMLCYAKNPSRELGEVYSPLSGKSFASAGWSGTQHTVDPINKINLAFLSNRSHNRVTYIDPSHKDDVKTDVNGRKILLLQNGIEMIDSSRFAWERDKIIHKCLDLALQYKMLEDITGYSKEEKIDKKLRKIK